MNTINEIKNVIIENKYTVLYFGTPTCSVCHSVKPQLKKVLDEYPQIKVKYIWLDKASEVNGEFQIFTFPALIMYVEGKEVFRMARFIPMEELKGKLDRIMEFV